MTSAEGSPLLSHYEVEVESGERFEFGENWSKYLALINPQRIANAEKSLQAMLAEDRLDGKSFLDIGSGSGLFSLAAHNLGARVRSFDYDPASVACTQELHKRYGRSPGQWQIERGSVLDKGYLNALGKFDIVYSWGVLHHTGAMWEALENAGKPVSANGKLFIAIYDDVGGHSRRWKKVKKAYCVGSPLTRAILLGWSFLYCWVPIFLRDFLKGRPFHTWRHYGNGAGRGMTPWRDLVDWVGGYPFEVARPEEIIDFYLKRGFALKRLVTSRGGCNEFVFQLEG